jgi:hypothetical protein
MTRTFTSFLKCFRFRAKDHLGAMQEYVTGPGLVEHVPSWVEHTDEYRDGTKEGSITVMPPMIPMNNDEYEIIPTATGHKVFYIDK